MEKKTMSDAPAPKQRPWPAAGQWRVDGEDELDNQGRGVGIGYGLCAEGYGVRREWGIHRREQGRRREDGTGKNSPLKITVSISETKIPAKGGGAGPTTLHQQKNRLKHINTHTHVYIYIYMYICIYVYMYIFWTVYRQSKLFQHLEIVQPPYWYNGAYIIKARKTQLVEQISSRWHPGKKLPIRYVTFLSSVSSSVRNHKNTPHLAAANNDE